MHSGQAAFDAALNAVNVGKFNIGSVGIGIATHSFYETINQAETKILFGHKVTDFPHVRQILTDSYTRLVAAKLYNERAVDYMRSASEQDRRYLLFDPIAKMKVTRQTERIMDDLLDVISARGFEKDTYFEMGAEIIKAMPRLEGTAHVNMALVLKFIPNYLFNQSDSLPLIDKRRDATDDAFLFRQGPAKGLSKITFAPWRPVYEEFAHLPNVARFLEQADGLGTMMTAAAPTGEQQNDLDFQLAVGELFTLVPYGQLILEEAKLRRADSDLIDESSASSFVTTLRMPLRCTARRPRPNRSSNGHSHRFASPSETTDAPRASSNGSARSRDLRDEPVALAGSAVRVHAVLREIDAPSTPGSRGVESQLTACGSSSSGIRGDRSASASTGSANSCGSMLTRGTSGAPAASGA